MYDFLLKLLGQAAELFKPEMTEDGFRSFLEKVLRIGGLLAKWTPPTFDDDAIATLKVAVDDDDIYDIIWTTIDGVFNNGGDKDAGLASASARLTAAADGKDGVNVVALLMLLKSLFDILTSLFNR